MVGKKDTQNLNFAVP